MSKLKPDIRKELEQAKDWIPDLFAYLCKRFIPKSYMITSFVWHKKDYDERLTINSILKRHTSGTVPNQVFEYLCGIENNISHNTNDFYERAFVISTEIDFFLRDIHPRNLCTSEKDKSKRPKALYEIFEYYKEKGYYSQNNTWGKVIPKPPIWRYDNEYKEPNTFLSFFENIMVFNEQKQLGCQYFKINFETIVEREDLRIDLALQINEKINNKKLIVAVVPLAEEENDLEIYTGIYSNISSKIPWYKVKIKDNKEAELKQRVDDVIKKLEAEEVNIVVLPELAVNPEIVKAISNRLKENVKQSKQQTNIQLVVTGTCLIEKEDEHTNLPYNDCVILDDTGEELWRQCKLNPYTLSTEKVKHYKIKTEYPEEEHMECIHTNNRLEVRDGILGRMIVLICEDLAKNEPRQTVLQYLLPEWIFTPVLSEEIGKRWWEVRNSWAIANHYPTNTIVSNSLELAMRNDEVKESYGIGLCVDFRQPSYINFFKVSKKHSPLYAIAKWSPEKWQEYKFNPV